MNRRSGMASKTVFSVLVAVAPLAVCALTLDALPTVGPAHGIEAYRPPQLGPWPPTIVKAGRGGTAYQRGDYATAFQEWSAPAQHGDAAAQHDLGVLYVEGRGVNHDVVAAWTWFRRAAASGYAPAQEALGNMYGYGIGVPLNYPLAYALKTAAREPRGAPALAISGAWPGCAEATDKSPSLKLLRAAMTQWFFCRAWNTALKIQLNPGILYDMHQLAQDLGERPRLSGGSPGRNR